MTEDEKLGATSVKFDAPLVYASMVQVGVAPEPYVIFCRPRPTRMHVSGEVMMQMEAVVAVQMSVQTMKDLSVVLANTVANYEKQFGVVETAYTRKLAAAQ